MAAAWLAAPAHAARSPRSTPRSSAGNVNGALAKARAWHAREPGDVLALIGLGDALEAEAGRACRRARLRLDHRSVPRPRGPAPVRRRAARAHRHESGARRSSIDTYAKRRRGSPRSHHRPPPARVRAAARRQARRGVRRDPRGPRPAVPGRAVRRWRARARRRRGPDRRGVRWRRSPAKRNEIEGELAKRSASRSPTRPSTRFILYWETDAQRRRLPHPGCARRPRVLQPSTHLPSGGELYADITTGYGPECFAIHGTPKAGPYRLSINYYSQGPMGYGMGLLQIVKLRRQGRLSLRGPAVRDHDRPRVRRPRNRV